MSPNVKKWCLIQLGVAGGIAAAIFLRSWLDGPPPSRVVMLQPEYVKEVKPVPSVAEVVARHLAWADHQAAAGLAPQLTPIRAFFAESRKGTRAFAEDALSFDSKWKFVVGYVTGGDEHREYLKQRFAARVFAPEELEQTLRYAIKAYLDHLDNVDARLLVDLKADLENVPSSSFSAGVDPSVIQQSLGVAIEGAVKAVETDFPREVGRELVSFVAGEILAAAGVQLATSAGILTVGGLSSPATLGVGLVVSLIVDAVLGWAYDKIVDPAGELSRKLDGTLTKLEQIIIEGNGDEPGLYKRLLAYGARRGEARTEAIKSVVIPNQVGP